MPLSTVKPSWISPSACVHCIQKSTTRIDAQLLQGALDTLDYCREHLIRWYYSREHRVGWYYCTEHLVRWYEVRDANCLSIRYL